MNSQMVGDIAVDSVLRYSPKMDKSWTEQVMPFSEVVAKIAATPCPQAAKAKIIAIDGCGGAGKSTFATLLSRALGDCPIAHTDDFASWENPTDWYPRVIKELLDPFTAGRGASFRRTDWVNGGPGEVVNIDPTPLLILEGVTASRQAFEQYLTFRCWIETPRARRLQRGIERDGEAMRTQWIQWMLAEDRYVAAEQPGQRAELVISGDTRTECDACRSLTVYARDEERITAGMETLGHRNVNWSPRDYRQKEAIG
jgi:uridine kinase